MNPSAGSRATSASRTPPVVVSSVSRDTDESWKSASPLNGTCDSSWFTKTSTVPGTAPGIAPIPSGIPENVKPPRPSGVSPEPMIGRTLTPGAAGVSIDGWSVR